MSRRYSTLAISAPDDAVLDHIAPIGLAASAGTALVVDLRPDRPGYGARMTVADLVADGVRRVDLSPDRVGVAVLGSSGIITRSLIRTMANPWGEESLFLSPSPDCWLQPVSAITNKKIIIPCFISHL